MITKQREKMQPSHYKGNANCPEHDPLFKLFYNMLEICSEENGDDCDMCVYYVRCRGIHDSLSNLCRDRCLTIREFANYVTTFNQILSGVSKDEKSSTSNVNNSSINSGN
jgi:hypothetical protein